MQSKELSAQTKLIIFSLHKMHSSRRIRAEGTPKLSVFQREQKKKCAIVDDLRIFSVLKTNSLQRQSQSAYLSIITLLKFTEDKIEKKEGNHNKRRQLQ